jgi:hypothetical protein
MSEGVVMQNNKNRIFEFLNPNDNDSFSKFRGLDLHELLFLIDDYYLELRSSLGFSDNITFGLEIEFEEAMRERLLNAIEVANLSQLWTNQEDRSLDTFLHKGFEICSPVLFDSKETWKEVKKVCSIIDKYAKIGNFSAAHVHVGVQVLKNNLEAWLNFMELWSVYENIIFRFSYGEFLTNRPLLYFFAKPVANDFQNFYQSPQVEKAVRKKKKSQLVRLLTELEFNRNCAVNFKNIQNLSKYGDKNTIEFRCPNGTLNPVIWQNNVNLFVNLLLASRDSSFDENTVLRRKILLAKEDINFDLYKDIYLDQALELCDLVFTNNLDKVYFLRQYLKSFQIATTPLERAKEFTLSYK